jgi:hypothetical protein
MMPSLLTAFSGHFGLSRPCLAMWLAFRIRKFLFVIQSSGSSFNNLSIHLHGHDFYLLGHGPGIFNDPTTLQYTNPPRKDVAMLPAAGWLVIGFLTDNPGAWLMHCHIVSHKRFYITPVTIPSVYLSS